MSFIIGRGREEIGSKSAGRIGRYRALDGSQGAPLYLDIDSPHAILVVGKRGYGKSYTLGVVAEELARADPIAPVVVDPMGAFENFAEEADAEIPAEVRTHPSVTPDSLDPRSWCALVGLSPESSAGALVWQAAQESSTLDGMCEHIRAADARSADERAAINHIGMADTWEVFDAESGLDAESLSGPEVTVLDLSGLADAPMNAVVRGVAESLYQARVSEGIRRLPWLALDEAHTFFDGVARSALETILTRGRAPGVSTVLVTQRPSAVPEVAVSQSDILLAHRLTAQADVAALQTARPTYLNESLEEKMPTEPGEVLIVDDSTETVHAAQIRERETVHDGDSATAEAVNLAERR
ncbi:MAG: DNA helicase HerA-like ATPase [Natronomonas sp.]